MLGFGYTHTKEAANVNANVMLSNNKY
jgi:hypothetical protein